MLLSFDRALLGANRGAVIGMLAAMAAMVFVNVVLRFTTDRSLLWVEETSRYLMIWLTFLGSGLVLRYGGHVGIDTLQEALPRHAAAIRAVIVIMLLGFFPLMAWLGMRYADFASKQTTRVLQSLVRAGDLQVPACLPVVIARA